jgi:hypothetical protein
MCYVLLLYSQPGNYVAHSPVFYGSLFANDVLEVSRVEESFIVIEHVFYHQTLFNIFLIP